METLRFGYSDAVIDPGTGITLAGYRHRFLQGIGNSGVLDHLHAKALSLRLGKTELLIVTLDLCMVSLELCDSLREAVSRKLSIPKEHIMLSIVHTHSAPTTCIPEYARGDFYGDKTKDNYARMEKEIEQYLESLKECILAICSEAHYRTHQGKISTTTLKMNLGYNRRYPITDANGNQTVKMHFNLWGNYGEEKNHDIDENIPILMIERTAEDSKDDYLEPYGAKKIVLFSVPYHPVVLGENSRVVSADYPGAACACIEEAIGYRTKAMFLLGACGDINALMACQENPDAVKIVGRAIGYGVTAALSNRKEVEVCRLDAEKNRRRYT